MASATMPLTLGRNETPMITRALIGVTAVAILAIFVMRVRDARARLCCKNRDRGIEATLALPEKTRPNAYVDEMELYKDLYYKLQHLERYPEVLPQSRDLLVSLFSETLTAAFKDPNSGILSIEHYSRESLASFRKNEDDKTAQTWEDYLARRRAGGPLEMFKDRVEAIWWLKQVTPVKYVDGAWLGHINKVTTPFALRRTVKDAFQVLSEELGDGDVEKNHVYIFQQLMKELNPELPTGDSQDYTHPRHEVNQLCIWKAAVAQLLISLFPHEFLPEILGFNMHFEGVSIETLKATKELKELKINAYYFLLHISIDNADSGHTAIAIETVNAYIEYIRKTQGELAAQQTWKRVQVGYILSANLPTTPDCATLTRPAVESFPRNEHEAEVTKIFNAKALVAHKIHCSSGMKIGRRTLVDWLEPISFASKQWQMDLLEDLSNLKPWVRKGDSGRSKLIQELSWEGKMFGSFTQTEVEAVARWIDSMGSPNPQIYWSFIGEAQVTSPQALQGQDICVNYPVFSSLPARELLVQGIPHSSILPQPLFSSAISVVTLNISKLIPLWFAHPCLLESFVCVPAKTTSKTASSILCLLRAQYGFSAEGPGVAGMDEVRRAKTIGLVELGMEMINGCGLPEPKCLKDVLETWRSEFALLMLHLAMRPLENKGLLLGMTFAFMSMYDAVAATTLLSAEGTAVLKEIAARGRDSLEICFAELKDDEVLYSEYCKGYRIATAEIEGCFTTENGL